MVYCLVDLIDRRREFLACQTIVTRKALLKGVHVFLKIADVNLLIANALKLLPVLQGIFRRIPQKRDHRDKKLRTNDIHLWILIGHIHNTVVVKLIVDLKKRNKDRILTVLFLAVFIQLLKKVLVFVLGGGYLFCQHIIV